MRCEATTFSVIIPVRNGADTIGDQLEALAPQVSRGRGELIVADNGSVDLTRAIVDEFAACSSFPVTWVDASSAVGVSHARNAGLRSARGDVVLVCDADDLVCEGWVGYMLHSLSTADLVGGSLEIRSLNSPITRSWRDVPLPDQLPNLLGFLPYAVGCNLGVWRHVAESVGGWDEALLAGGDDVDFSWRVQLAGHTLVAAPEAAVAYRLRSSLGATMRQGFAYGRAELGIYRRFSDAGLVVPTVAQRTKDLLRSVVATPTDWDPRAVVGQKLFRVGLLMGKLLATAEFQRLARLDQ